MINIEIKAHCPDSDQETIRAILREHGARFVGEDHQVDTYFRTSRGRLKLREGNIENALIFYEREDQQGPKRSNVMLYETERGDALKAVLTAALGILAVVDKRREIYFINNVKFHLDHVQGLGAFVEIEAIDRDESIGMDALQEQCEYYLSRFGIPPEALVADSYSDLLIKK